MYAAGKIPGSFFRREGIQREGDAYRAHDRPADPAALPEGLALRDPARRDPDVGRPGRPLRHPRDEWRLRGSGDLPGSVAETVGAVRIGKLDGDFVVNPTRRTRELDLDLIVAGTNEAILMVEAGANGVTEAEILNALDIAHGEIKKICAAIEELQQKAGKEKIEVEATEIDEGLITRSAPPTARLWSTRSPPRASSSVTRQIDKGQGRGRSPSTRPSPTTLATTTRSSRARPRLPLPRSRRTPIRKSDRRRQEAPRRPGRGRDPTDRVRGRRFPARARLGALHPR